MGVKINEFNGNRLRERIFNILARYHGKNKRHNKKTAPTCVSAVIFERIANRLQLSLGVLAILFDIVNIVKYRVISCDIVNIVRIV